MSVTTEDQVSRNLEYLSPGILRENAFLDHPIIRDEARLSTPAVKAVFDVVKDAVIHRDTGVSFIAEPRFGKSFAIDVLEHFVPQSFPNLPIYRTNATGHQNPSEKAFFTDILTDFKLSYRNGASAAERRNQVVSQLVAGAHDQSSDCVMLFVDEAQNWHENEYSWLRDVTNDLRLDKIRLITVMFAHPDLLALRASLIRRRTDLIGRFFLHPRAFKGIDTFQDLEKILKMLDDVNDSEFPLETGISYSCFFRPQEYLQNGWRLHHEAKPCWQAFNREMKKQGGEYEIGMRWLMATIRSVLCTFWEYEIGKRPDIPRNIWQDAVNRSGFSESLSPLRTPRVKKPR
jgi:hypothetical protein